MSDGQRGGKPTNPDNPYNIDFARERRLKRIFQLVIGAGFIFAAVMLAIGYALDIYLTRESDDIAPVTPYSTPAQPVDQAVTSR